MVNKPLLRKPYWLKRALPEGPCYEEMRRLISSKNLNTVCKEANCPNRFECYQKGTATFMILGNRCTRNCRFCAVHHGAPACLDETEPVRVAQVIREMGVSYAVITSVTRDDLPDGGAGMFAKTILSVRAEKKEIRVEVLVPDFKGDPEAIRLVADVKPDVFGHNIETVKKLYPRVRPEAVYERSLDVLRTVKSLYPAMPTKSGIMLGLGETQDEIKETFDHIVKTGCDFLTIGQYLSPGKDHLPVERYIPPDDFIALKEIAINAGFKQVQSGPLVRSSYEAAQMFENSLSSIKLGEAFL